MHRGILKMIGLTGDQSNATRCVLTSTPYPGSSPAMQSSQGSPSGWMASTPQWAANTSLCPTARCSPRRRHSRTACSQMSMAVGLSSVSLAHPWLTNGSAVLAQIANWWRGEQEVCKLPPADTNLLRHYASGEQAGVIGHYAIASRAPVPGDPATGQLIFDKVMQPFDLVFMLLRTNLETQHCVPKETGEGLEAESVSFRTVVGSRVRRTWWAIYPPDFVGSHSSWPRSTQGTCHCTQK